MTLDGLLVKEFVAKVKSGELLVNGGGAHENVLVEGRIRLPVSDVDAVTAEAFNQGVFNSDDVKWDDARNQVVRAMEDVG